MPQARVTLDEVRTGLRRGELFVEYLPIVRLSDQRCMGAEALARWWRRGAILQPGEFIPIIENTPLSGTLTYWVIDTVAAELGEWLGEHDDAQISINVPPEILGRGGLEYAAARSGLRARADQIVLEITERGIPDQLGLQALDAIAKHGVHIALDDVSLKGVNLALLARCHFSVLKLDRHLTAELVQDAPQPEWLAGLAALLRECPMQIVAEGVERVHQADALRAAGVQLAQGYLFSKTLTASGFRRFYDRTTGRKA